MASKVIVLLALVAITFAAENNVCKTFPAYYHRDRSKQCYYNPDMHLSAPEIIVRHGYPLLTYKITTADGYILTIFRIPRGKKPVVLQHGFASNCNPFVNKGRKSLAFILADLGMDVWIGNFRGDPYSLNHTTLSTSSKQFWDFSFQENGIYDLPALFDLVGQHTTEKIIYIGYSMGNTAVYVYSSTFPEEAAAKLKVIVSMAPVAFINHMKTVFRFLVPLWPLLRPIVELATNGNLPVSNPELIRVVCFPFPFQMRLCDSAQMLFFGFNYPQEDPETLPIALLQNVGDTSVKTLSHFIQLYSSGKFRQYDYGKPENIRRYNSSSPPDYDLGSITVPIYFMRGENDLLATEPDVQHLYDSLPEEATPYPIFLIPDKRFSHANFLNAKDVVGLCYKFVVNFLVSNNFI